MDAAMKSSARDRKCVDSHQHVFWHGRDDAGLVHDMDEQGIDYAWLLSWEIAPWEDHIGYHGVLNPIRFRSDGTHPGILLEDLLIARNRYPSRFVLGYCPNPQCGDAATLLRHAVAMYGVRVCGEWKFRIPFDDPRCIELFRAAGELGLPVVLHLDLAWRRDGEGRDVYCSQWFGGSVDNLERAMVMCPDTVFVGHAPGFWCEISGGDERLKGTTVDCPVAPGGRLYDLFDRYPNLYADISAGSGRKALMRDPEHARRFITQFRRRLLFGRDYYGGELNAFLETLDLASDIRDDLYFQNAERLVSPPS